MATYFHIPPEGGWEEHSCYVVEVSKQQGNPIFSGILHVGFLDSNDQPFNHTCVHTISNTVGYMKDFQYIKVIRKIDMSIPNQGKQIKELNIFELKQHMKEVNIGIKFTPVYSTSN